MKLVVERERERERERNQAENLPNTRKVLISHSKEVEVCTQRIKSTKNELHSDWEHSLHDRKHPDVASLSPHVLLLYVDWERLLFRQKVAVLGDWVFCKRNCRTWNQNEDMD